MARSHRWFGLLTVLLVHIAFCPSRAIAADDPPELVQLTTTNDWPAAWPPIKFPGPVINSITNFKSLADGFEVTVGFLKTNSIIRGLGDKDLPERILGQAMTNFFRVEVTDKRGPVPARVVMVDPPQLTREADSYRVRVRFTDVTPEIGGKIKVSIRNKYRAHQGGFRQRHIQWLATNMPVVLSSLASLGGSTNQLGLVWQGLLSAPEKSSVLTQFTETATNTIGRNFQKTGADEGKPSANTLATTTVGTSGIQFTNYLSVFRDDVTRLLFDNVNKLREWQKGVVAAAAANPPVAAPAAPANITTNKVEELFWVMAYRYGRFRHGTEKENAPNVPDLLFDPETAEFKWSGRIAGFTVVADKLEGLPEQEVVSNFGRGMANHFHVFRVCLLNTNTSAVLIYGDQITLRCRAREFSWEDKNDFRKLIKSVPERDLHVDPRSPHVARYWRSSRNGETRGKVLDREERLLARPFSLHFLIRGYEDREFYTTKAKVFRTFDVIADVATAVIPFVKTQGYSDGAGIFSGVFVPATKKLFGDATEVQRQTFLLESLPPYVELDRGQSLSKYIYFPKYGLTGVAEDKVVFLTEFGTAQELEVKVALLIKVGGANGNSGSNDTDNDGN